MHFAAKIFAFTGAFAAASAASAQQAVIDGVPAGVIISDDGAASAERAPISFELAPVEPDVIVPAPLDTAVAEPVPLATVPLTTQSPASTRSPAKIPAVAVPAGTVLDAATIAPQIDLAPGETVLQVIAVPSIVKVPAAEPVPAYVINSPSPLSVQRAAPEPKIDPVSGRLRDTAGWTGDIGGPASIGCFPAGACAVLNQQ